MTIRQQFLQLIYPLFKRITKLLGKGPAIIENRENILPAVSFYSLSFISNAGEKISMNQYAGKKILIVNTASDCGYTAQYAELQQLQDAHAEMLAVIGFPANDFKQQERRDDDEIAAFCKKNYGPRKKARNPHRPEWSQPALPHRVRLPPQSQLRRSRGPPTEGSHAPSIRRPLTLLAAANRGTTTSESLP